MNKIVKKIVLGIIAICISLFIFRDEFFGPSNSEEQFMITRFNSQFEVFLNTELHGVSAMSLIDIVNNSNKTSENTIKLSGITSKTAIKREEYYYATPTYDDEMRICEINITKIEESNLNINE